MVDLIQREEGEETKLEAADGLDAEEPAADEESDDEIVEV